MTDLRSLPPEVLTRLSTLCGDDKPGECLREGVDIVQRSDILEARRFATPECRVESDGSVVIDGYATVYEYPYNVAGGPPWGWRETIAEGAAKKAIREKDRVGLLTNHDASSAFGLALAANYAGTLELESDKVGLRMAATFPPGNRPNVARDFLIDSLERGLADSMSFAFQVVKQKWNDDYTERRITELRLFDVSIVNYPANPAAVAQIRTERTEPKRSAGMDLAFAKAQAEALSL
jgi:HK97 family phage prohead protease